MMKKKKSYVACRTFSWYFHHFKIFTLGFKVFPNLGCKKKKEKKRKFNNRVVKIKCEN
jgi:hypothetical protein